MKILKRWLEGQRRREMERRARELRRDFRIEEKDGRVWLTFMGVAFREFSGLVSAQEMTEAIEHVRAVAVRHGHLEVFEGKEAEGIKPSAYNGDNGG